MIMLFLVLFNFGFCLFEYGSVLGVVKVLEVFCEVGFFCCFGEFGVCESGVVLLGCYVDDDDICVVGFVCNQEVMFDYI